MTRPASLSDTSRCVRCGICKTLCPTYLDSHHETMSARGRIALLGELETGRLFPNRRLADMIFSCMLCGACKNICPTGIDIPEAVYQGRRLLKKSYTRGRILRKVLRSSLSSLDRVLSLLRGCQKVLYPPLHGAGLIRYVPEITAEPFHKGIQVYKTIKKTGRAAIFAGCSVNYFQPHLGHALTRILLSKGYEVVVFKGELCCGAPLRSSGFEEEASDLARNNIELFSKVRAEAVISLCPTCTMVIRDQYPILADGTITNVMDVNEFLAAHDIAGNLQTVPSVVTYHDPCHLNFGLAVRDKPREILQKIKGITLTEMKKADECCGFAGLFSMHFRTMSENIGKKKISSIEATQAETVVTSCPGCIMQIEALKHGAGSAFSVKHIVEVIDEAMHG